MSVLPVTVCQTCQSVIELDRLFGWVLADLADSDPDSGRVCTTTSEPHLPKDGAS